MCGIAGYIDPLLSAHDGREMLERMCEQIVHRGPDDDGFGVYGPAGLSMRRLSIIDLAGGHQPIHTDDGRFHIVFNGEIYNFRELREELQATGYRFHTSSDTEVILAAYVRHGPECVHRFNGMFAIAIWDSLEQSLWLVRDRLGVKPLYYDWDGKRLVFGSEIKSLLAAGTRRRFSEEALWHYLTFRFVPQPLTIWTDVSKLLPGHMLTLRIGRAPSVRRYWSPPLGGGPREVEDEVCVKQFGDLFEDAVRLRLIADVPVGILLSGGLDSSAVTAAVRQRHRGAVKTFSVGYSGAFADDERGYARTVANHLGTEHSDVEIGEKDFTEFLPTFVRLSDEPLADLASVPLHYVSRLARSSVKVVLSGEGADEVLAGYDLERAVQRWQLLAKYRKLPKAIRAAIARAAARAPARLRRAAEEGSATAIDALLANPPTMTLQWTTGEKRELMRSNRFSDSLDIVRRDLREAMGSSPLEMLLHAYRQSWMVEDLLMKADRMTMGASIELRVPFLDYRLVEWSVSLPAEKKIRRTPNGWRTKWVLREYCRDKLPPEILTREKRGFPAPANEWLVGSLRGWAKDMLCPPDARIKQWLRPERVDEILTRATSTASSSAERGRAWTLLVLEQWARTWGT